jgi:predicted nuclease of predicted toxin-antitoxin system
VKDREVLSIAVAQERWIVTFDRDYGELIFSQSFPTPPALIYLRLHSYRPELPGRLLVDLLREPSNLAGQFVVIQDENLRKRPLPLR